MYFSSSVIWLLFNYNQYQLCLVQVKDNAELLNKSLKKQKKEKLKKKKDWEGRVQAQEKQKEDRQKKRKENIKKKKTEKKEHKIKLNAKKGRFAVTV